MESTIKSEFQWFVLHTLSGQEQKVKDSIEKRLKVEEMGELIKEVLIPTEKVAEVKKGKKTKPIIAMRTVSGGPVHSLRDVPGFAWKDYLQKRAVEVAPIFEKSGIKSWTEFCVRFAHSFPLGPSYRWLNE